MGITFFEIINISKKNISKKQERQKRWDDSWNLPNYWDTWYCHLNRNTGESFFPCFYSIFVPSALVWVGPAVMGKYHPYGLKLDLMTLLVRCTLHFYSQWMWGKNSYVIPALLDTHNDNLWAFFQNVNKSLFMFTKCKQTWKSKNKQHILTP